MTPTTRFHPHANKPEKNLGPNPPFPEKKFTKKRREKESLEEELKTHESKIYSVLNGRFLVMGRHTFSSLILYTPPTMISSLITVGLTETTVAFSRAMGVSSSPIRMHGEEKIRNVMGGSDVDVT